MNLINNKMKIIKPNLDSFFALMPFIGVYIKADYDNAFTPGQYLDLIHKWLDISETTKNETKAQWYKASAYRLYSLLTGQSYDSKNLNILIDE